MSTNITKSKRIAIKDEGVVKTSDVNSIDFTGTGVTATNVGNDVTVNITGGGVTQIVAGTNVTISPAGGTGVVTVNAAGGGTEIGALIGGGVVVEVFNDNGVNKALIASLTNLSTSLIWTIPAFQTALIGATAQSFFNGLTNTNAIIAQTGAAATTAYAAGIARLFAGGGYNDWYLPALWELNICYNAAGIVNKITGVSPILNQTYWSSTESTATNAQAQSFSNSLPGSYGKSTAFYVRAVRIHTI